MTQKKPVGSIVIAAHNESTVIERCLRSLHPLAIEGIAQVVVVCNGCTDDTVARASSFAGVQVIDLPIASKIGALRAGDRAALEGPRIYLDADVVLSASAAKAVFAALATGAAAAGRPLARFDYRRAEWPVSAWYRVRESLPSISRALWGAGIYAMSVKGRARFGEFPDLVSDDLYVDSLFADSEVIIVDTEPVVVTTPRRLADLMRILIRTYRTQSDVARPKSPAISDGQQGQLRDLVGFVRRHPARVADAAIYILIIVATRCVAAARPRMQGWARDDSSRL